jgi:hypothetical protein
MANLYHFIATIQNHRVDLYFVSEAQAKRYNPLAKNFRKMGVLNELSFL